MPEYIRQKVKSKLVECHTALPDFETYTSNQSVRCELYAIYQFGSPSGSPPDPIKAHQIEQQIEKAAIDNTPVIDRLLVNLRDLLALVLEAENEGRDIDKDGVQAFIKNHANSTIPDLKSALGRIENQVAVDAIHPQPDVETMVNDPAMFELGIDPQFHLSV